jgi:ADP-ribosylglycohydrolase
MIGAIAGDVIGSVYEFHNVKRDDFPLFDPKCTFTDDSVLTVALADAILSGQPYADLLRQYWRLYPHRGYGGQFRAWARTPERGPYGSFGNGAAMRVSPAGWAFGSLEETLEKAREFTAVTHDHPEGIKGGQATAAAIFLARTASTKDQIRDSIEKSFGYDLRRTCDQIRPGYAFNEICQETVPEAIIAFLESDGYERAVRLAVSLGGDSDTLACIAGSIAEAFYGGVPRPIREKTLSLLDVRLRRTTLAFAERYSIPMPE